MHESQKKFDYLYENIHDKETPFKNDTVRALSSQLLSWNSQALALAAVNPLTLS